MHSTFNHQKPIAIVKASYSSATSAALNNATSAPEPWKSKQQQQEQQKLQKQQQQQVTQLTANFLQRSEFKPVAFSTKASEFAYKYKQENRNKDANNNNNNSNNVNDNSRYKTPHKYPPGYVPPIETNLDDVTNFNDITKNNDVTLKKDQKTEFHHERRTVDPLIEAGLVTNEPFSFEEYGYPFGARDKYYFLDSDLETITEESSILESDVESIIARRKSREQKKHSPRSTSSSVRQKPDSMTSDDEVRSNQSNTPSSISERQIDPTAHQRIVYAKCLSPPQTRHNNKATKKTTPNNNIEPSIDQMFEAAKAGNFEILNKHFRSEMCDTVDEHGNTVLHVALKHGRLKCAQRLSRGACAEAVSFLNDEMLTPTALAIQNGNLDAVRWMVANTGAKEELTVSTKQASLDGGTMRPPLLHIAARFNQEEILNWLCDVMSEEGYPIDMADQHSNTAVHEAAKFGHLICIQTLVGRGASVTVLNSQGDTPCRMADRHNHSGCVGYLVVVETCVSLAQQIVGLKSDMEALENKNKELTDKLSRQQEPSPKVEKLLSHSSTSPFQSPHTVSQNSGGKSPSSSHSSSPRGGAKPPSPRINKTKQQQNILPSPKITTNNLNKTPMSPKSSVPPSNDKTSPPSYKQTFIFPKKSNDTNQSSNKTQFAMFNAAGRIPNGQPANNLTSLNRSVNTGNNIENKKSFQNFQNASTVNDQNNVAKSAKKTNINVKKSNEISKKDPVKNTSTFFNRFLHPYPSKMNTNNNNNNTVTNSTITNGLQHLPKSSPSDNRSSTDASSETSSNSSSKTLEAESLHDEENINQELQDINKTSVDHKRPPISSTNKLKRRSKRYDRLSLDEMLKAARDTRHLPSPTVSMCTEDSTMETVEVMRERLAEASRWFMVQQSRAPVRNKHHGNQKNNHP